MLYFGGHYNIDDLMDAIQDHIAPIKGNCAWGYTPAYFLSARFNLHRNYAEHYLGKGDLTNRDINHILAAIAPNIESNNSGSMPRMVVPEAIATGTIRLRVAEVRAS